MENSNHTKELDILVNLEYQLSNHRWSNMYQMMADLCADIYPFVDDINLNKDSYPLLSKLAKFIKECQIETRGSLDTYSPKMQSGYLLGRIDSFFTISELKHFAAYLLAISYIDDDAVIYLNNEWACILSSPWGVPMEEPKETTKESSKDAVTSELQQTKAQVKPERHFKAKSDAERRLEQFWYKLTSGNFDYQYFWRNKITSEEYNELKNRIKECVYENKRGFAKRYARVIALYIAEWYKREYNGNDGKQNAIKAIGLSCRPEEIWNNSNFPNNYLSGQKNNRYLDSLYVLGGLPINYLIHKKFNSVFKEIQSVYKQKEDEEDLQGNIFINNNTLQDSMRSQWGSLHMYFDALMNDNYPFAEEDYDKEPFRTFMDYMEEWKPMRKKFFIEWIVEGNTQVEMFRRKMRLYVTPEAKGERNKSIQYGRLAIKGINTNEKNFRLYVAFNDEDPEENDENLEFLTFYNTYDGYFTAQMSRNYHTFKRIPSEAIHKVTLYIKVGWRYKEVYTEEYEDFMQLFETGQYSILSSKKSDAQSYVLMPYSTKVVVPADLESKSVYFEEGGDAFKLVKIVNFITIEDIDGEKHEFYRRDDDIIVISTPQIHDISYEDNFKCKYVYQNENEEQVTSNVSILFNKDNLAILSVGQFHNPELLSSKDYVLEYKSNKDGYYHLWAGSSSPSSGMIKVRISYHDIQSKVEFLYIPAKKEPIIRDCNNATVKIDKALILKERPEGLVSSEEDIEGFSCYKDNPYADSEQDYYQLKVNCGNGYVEIPVFRSLNMEELYFDGKSVKKRTLNDATRRSTDIPFLLRKHYAIRRIDKNGVQRYNLKNDNVDYLDFNFIDDSESSVKGSVKVGHGKDKITISYYYCKSTFEHAKDIIHVDGNPEEYKFYYWSMNPSDAPELISTPDAGIIKLDARYVNSQRGIIFQSLAPDLKPTDYYAPIRLGKCPTSKDDKLPRACFNIAVVYHTPFRIFEPVFDYIKETDSKLEDLAMTFMAQETKGMAVEEKLAALIRFSHEMYFSWPFLNRYTWKNMPSRIFEKIPQMERYFISKENAQLLKEIYRNIAKNLFLNCGQGFSYENKKSLNEFSEVYWSHNTEPGYHFPNINDDRWNGFDKRGRNIVWKVGGKHLEEQAVTFMRPFSKSGSKVVGFTYLENKKFQGEEYRSIKKITAFLRMLYTDEQSFVKIMAFLKEYLFDYTH